VGVKARFERGKLIGIRSADFIRASGHEHRAKQAGHMTAPDHAPKPEKTPCTRGAVHT
jgi:hypothetical protein